MGKVVSAVKKFIAGKNSPKVGKSPAIALINPKHARNVGMAIRIASCYDISQVWYTGNRFRLDDGQRLPREERMKGYGEVELIQNDYLFDCFSKDIVPVAVEVRDNSELLPNFEHPENALYVFGPEDGSIPSSYLRHCHRLVVIPTKHCLNLATAVSTVMYDRMYKRYQAGKGELITPGEYEDRGWPEFEADDAR